MPLEIQGLLKDEVTFVWEDEKTDVWPARMLRLSCVCAHCKSEDTGDRLIVDEDVPMDITVKAMHIVGNYGLGIQFSDGHSTGIYRFSTLRSKDQDDG